MKDCELIQKLKELKQTENKVLVEILEYLVEVEARTVHLKSGYSSMFSFCISCLGYSESAASRRIRAARALKHYPEIGQYLLLGRVSLSTLSQVASILEPENYLEVLGEIEGKSQSEVDLFLCKSRNKVERKREQVKPVIRSIGEKSSKNDTSDTGPSLFDFSSQQCVEESEDAEVSYSLSFTVSADSKEKLEEVKRNLSGKYPRGVSLEIAFNELLNTYLKKKAPRKARKKKATRSKVKRTRYISKQVKEEVCARDHRSCTYVSPEGRRCCSTWDLELDHIVPYALGGSNEPSNLRVRCRAHNALYAEEVFGNTYKSQPLRL